MAKLEETRETAIKNLKDSGTIIVNDTDLTKKEEKKEDTPVVADDNKEVSSDAVEQETKAESETTSEPKSDENVVTEDKNKEETPEIPLTPDVPIAPVDPVGPLETPAPSIEVPDVSETNTLSETKTDFVIPSIQGSVGDTPLKPTFNFGSDIDIPSSTSTPKILSTADDVNEFLTGYYDMRKRHEEEENNYLKSFTEKVTDVIHDRNNLKGGQQKLISILSGGEPSTGPVFGQAEERDPFNKAA